VERIRAAVEPLAFDRAYGAFWWGVMDGDARAKVLRSADRYLAALSPDPPILAAPRRRGRSPGADRPRPR
jgi:hypothetical protein